MLVTQHLPTGFNMSDLPHCPKCNSEYTYEDQAMYVCPECAHEWAQDAGDGRLVLRQTQCTRVGGLPVQPAHHVGNHLVHEQAALLLVLGRQAEGPLHPTTGQFVEVALGQTPAGGPSACRTPCTRLMGRRPRRPRRPSPRLWKRRQRVKRSPEGDRPFRTDRRRRCGPSHAGGR